MRWDHLEQREAYQRAERDSRELKAISDPAKVLPRLTETEVKEEVERLQERLFIAPSPGEIDAHEKQWEAKLLAAQSALKAAEQRLVEVREAWKRVAGFAVCESSPGHYRITIDYKTLEQAQNAYSAMHEITVALALSPKVSKPQYSSFSASKLTGSTSPVDKG